MIQALKPIVLADQNSSVPSFTNWLVACGELS